MTRALGTAWLIRFGFVAALSVVLSGAPRAAVAATGVTVQCAQECGGSTGDFGCPPSCSAGACARIAPATMGDALECSVITPRAERYLCEDAAAPAAPSSDGVFHPPTR